MNPWTCFDVSMDGAVAHVRMNHPERHNAMTPAFWAEIPRAVPRAGCSRRRARCRALSFHADAVALAAIGTRHLLAHARAHQFRNGCFDQSAELWGSAASCSR